MLLISVFLLLWTSFGFCKVHFPHQKHSTITQHPYLIRLQWPDCPAALISPYFVLASEQCLTSTTPVYSGHKEIKAGHPDENKPDEVRMKSTVHKRTSLATGKGWPLDRDIVVLSLKPPLILGTANIKTIELPKRGDELQVGTPVTTVNFDGGRRIIESSLEIIDREYCKRAYKLPKSLEENFICAANLKCPLDTKRAQHGTLLVHDGVLYGILFSGMLCPTRKSPSLFTNLTASIDEIRNIIES